MELLERDQQLAELEGGQVDARQGRGCLALVSGEAGIGKTSLVESFARKQERTTRVFWGACDALFTPRPLGPIYDMAPQIGGQLQKLLASDAPPPSVFSTILNELQRRPAIMVFEDVHWADEVTLDLLRFIGRRVSQTSALLVLTYRDAELGQRHPLRSLLGDLASSPHIRRVSLPPLSQKAVQELVGSRQIDAAALHRQTEGNPFYITEVLANPASGIPASIREAVLAQAARLSASGYAVLEAAAVIGRKVETWLLAEVTGAEAPAVEDCIAMGMLLGQGDDLAFRHELARETILNSISPLRRQVLHRLVLEALLSSPVTKDDLARLVHYAEVVGDRDAIVEYAPTAARQASAAGAHRTAARLYGLVLNYLDTLPAAERAQVLEAHALENSFINEYSTTVADRRQAIELWQEMGNSLKVGENMAFLALALNGLERWADAVRSVQDAIQILESQPPGRELAMAYRIQTIYLLNDRDYSNAVKLAQKAFSLAENQGNPQALAMAYDTLGSAWMYLDYEHGSKLMIKGRDLAAEAGLDGRVANIFANHGSISCELFRFAQAERYLAEGIAYTTERDLDMIHWYLLAWYSLTLLYLGRWNEAQQSAVEVLHRAGNSAQYLIPALVVLGRLQHRRGEDINQRFLDQALETALKSGFLQYIAPVRAARAEAAWYAGDLKSSLAETSYIYDLAVSGHHPWLAGELAYFRWLAGEQVEVHDWMALPYAYQIGGDWQSAADEWKRLGCPYEQAHALADGDIQAQIAALEIFEQLGARPDAVRLRRKLREAGVTSVPHQPRPSTRENPFGLTDRQMDVLSLLSDNLTNAEIAARLHISPKTVDHHVSAVLAKLNVQSRRAAADLARQHPHFNPTK